MQGMFTEVKLVAGGAKVDVTGDFDPGNRKITKAKVLFMIVQGDGGPDTVILDGEAEWKRSANSTGKVQWSVRVDNRGVFADGRKGRAKLKPSTKDPMVRGIAHAIAFRPARSRRGQSPFEPPQIEALTWCVETPLGPRPAAQQSRTANGRRPVRRLAGARRGMVAR
jgi:hypothetical protein